MALTQTNWTPLPTDTGRAVWECSVTATTAENDAYTVRTPKELDPTKPWTVYLSFSATPDGAALPIDIWTGFSDSFALSGDGANVVATPTLYGGKFKQILDDAVLAVSPLVYSINIDPNLAVADVVTVAAIATGLKVKVPVAPYYAFNANGGSTLAAQTHYWKIVQ